MARSFGPVRRIAALSVALALLAAPLATAQSRESGPPNAAPASQALLSPAAFARLVQVPRTDAAPAPVVTGPARRIELLRSVTAVATRDAKATLAQKPAAPQRSWIARHKMAFIVPGIVVGAILGAFGLAFVVLTEID